VPSRRKDRAARQRGAGDDPGGDEDAVRLAHANQLRFLSDAGADVTVMVSAASRRAASYESHRDQQKRDAQHDDDGRVRLDLHLPPPWRKGSLLGKDCSIRSRPCCGPTRPGGDAVPPREAGVVGHLEKAVRPAGIAGGDQSGDQIGERKPPKRAEVAEAADGQTPLFPRET
jgi:hypothetical protein